MAGPPRPHSHNTCDRAKRETGRLPSASRVNTTCSGASAAHRASKPHLDSERRLAILYLLARNCAPMYAPIAWDTVYRSAMSSTYDLFVLCVILPSQKPHLDLELQVGHSLLLLETALVDRLPVSCSRSSYASRERSFPWTEPGFPALRFPAVRLVEELHVRSRRSRSVAPTAAR
jgi:hypothetical protein